MRILRSIKRNDEKEAIIQAIQVSEKRRFIAEVNDSDISRCTDPVLKVQFFSCFQVWHQGELIHPKAWRANKSKTILKLLLLHKGRVYTKDELIEHLFPDVDYKKASVNLRVRISELRHVLEPNLKKGAKSKYILTAREGYYFNPAIMCHIDTEIFESFCEKGWQAIEAKQWQEAIMQFGQVMGLYQGGFSPEDRYEDWALPFHQRWKEAYLIALSNLAEAYAHSGNLEQAILWCHKALCVEEHREKLYRQLMRYHLLADDAEAALQVYERYRTRILDTTSGNPSPQIEQLHLDILNQNLSDISSKTHPTDSVPVYSRASSIRPLTQEEEETLKCWKQNPLHQTWQRAQIILLAAQKKDVQTISEYVDLSPRRTLEWIKRFNKDGLSGVTAPKFKGRFHQVNIKQQPQVF